MRNRILATVAVSGLVAFAVGFTTSRTAYAAPIDDSRAAPASVLSPLAACWHNHQTFECTQSACIDGPAVADYYACNPSIVTMAVTLCDGWFCTPPEQLVFDIINTALPAVIGHITLTRLGTSTPPVYTGSSSCRSWSVYDIICLTLPYANSGCGIEDIEAWAYHCSL